MLELALQRQNILGMGVFMLGIPINYTSTNKREENSKGKRVPAGRGGGGKCVTNDEVCTTSKAVVQRSFGEFMRQLEEPMTCEMKMCEQKK